MRSPIIIKLPKPDLESTGGQIFLLTVFCTLLVGIVVWIAWSGRSNDATKELVNVMSGAVSALYVLLKTNHPAATPPPSPSPPPVAAPASQAPAVQASAPPAPISASEPPASA